MTDISAFVVDWPIATILFVVGPILLGIVAYRLILKTRSATPVPRPALGKPAGQLVATSASKSEARFSEGPAVLPEAVTESPDETNDASDVGPAPIAAVAANVEAALHVADLYWTGSGGLPRDPAIAVRFYLSAARAGDVAAARMLSIAFGSGDGVARDRGLQLRWAREAAEKGDVFCQNTTGYLALTGAESEQDYADAATWLALAAARSQPGELRDSAIGNLRVAITRLGLDQRAAVAKRAADWLTRQTSADSAWTQQFDEMDDADGRFLELGHGA